MERLLFDFAMSNRSVGDSDSTQGRASSSRGHAESDQHLPAPFGLTDGRTDGRHGPLVDSRWEPPSRNELICRTVRAGKARADDRHSLCVHEVHTHQFDRGGTPSEIEDHHSVGHGATAQEPRAGSPTTRVRHQAVADRASTGGNAGFATHRNQRQHQRGNRGFHPHKRQKVHPVAVKAGPHSHAPVHARVCGGAVEDCLGLAGVPSQSSGDREAAPTRRRRGDGQLGQ